MGKNVIRNQMFENNCELGEREKINGERERIK